MHSRSYKKSLKTRRPRQDRKALLFLSLLVKRFDRSSSPTYKKDLPLPNQLNFWTEHVQSILKVNNKVRSLGGYSKGGWWSLFSKSVVQTLRLGLSFHCSCSLTRKKKKKKKSTTLHIHIQCIRNQPKFSHA